MGRLEPLDERVAEHEGGTGPGAPAAHPGHPGASCLGDSERLGLEAHLGTGAVLFFELLGAVSHALAMSQMEKMLPQKSEMTSNANYYFEESRWLYVGHV